MNVETKLNGPIGKTNTSFSKQIVVAMYFLTKARNILYIYCTFEITVRAGVQSCIVQNR